LYNIFSLKLFDRKLALTHIILLHFLVLQNLIFKLIDNNILLQILCLKLQNLRFLNLQLLINTALLILFDFGLRNIQLFLVALNIQLPINPHNYLIFNLVADMLSDLALQFLDFLFVFVLLIFLLLDNFFGDQSVHFEHQEGKRDESFEGFFGVQVL
jgi:hypothetical protein